MSTDWFPSVYLFLPQSKDLVLPSVQLRGAGKALEALVCGEQPFGTLAHILGGHWAESPTTHCDTLYTSPLSLSE